MSLLCYKCANNLRENGEICPLETCDNFISKIVKSGGDGWINLTDAMPAVGQGVEVKMGAVSFKVSLKISPILGLCFCDDNNIYRIPEIEGWRPIKERKPDFGKLKKGDLIYLKTKEDEYSGFFLKISICNYSDVGEVKYINVKPAAIYTCLGSEQPIELSFIKKITRINIEDKTFEEI